ncbi:PIN domain-containing protein [Thermococcus sp. LS2]|uniref:PIN domain-containing protein n=1 Tax=Thermococcus sp. LS2 TaxID=1638260 RepID=UPI00143BFBE8|nr:PIN domain-containing protein [Thermococcus sp. LS2]NJE12281.1 hypothetical protein [Thermococcus sp. LS2]
MELLIDKAELQILLNLLPDDTIVSYPLYGNFPLLKFRRKVYGYEIEALAKPEDFSRVLSEKKDPLHDLPNYKDFHECVLASGIIKYANLNEFKKHLESYEILSKRVIFAPDTNIFYHRFISTYPPLRRYELAVVDVVIWEIEQSMNYKYHRGHIHALKRILYNSHLLDEFYNRRMKKSRKAAYIALKEFKALKDRIIEVRRVHENTGTNDELIVRSLKRFDKETPSLVILLTADVAMTDIAELEGLEYFLFEYPYEDISLHYATPYHMRTLLFNLAAVFGVIQIGDVLVFGEFGGKVKLNELKLKFLHNSIYKEFTFHLELSRKLRELKIEK